VTALPTLPRRDADAHKGDFGRVLVVAGSRGMAGAAALCGSAALRGGAGLVTVACPESAWAVIGAINPCLMTLPVAEEQGRLAAAAFAAIRDEARMADVIAVGPGLGRSPGVSHVVTELLRCTDKPIVLDADGLNALGSPPEALRHNRGPRVLTPHPGELARLIATNSAVVQTRRAELTRDFARRFGVVLVLKGHRTLVQFGDELFTNSTGNPGMATGGSGDVLTGLIAALIGQRLRPFDAAVLGVYLHGLAGDLAREVLGEASLTAADLLDYLPKAFLRHAPPEGPTHARDLPALPTTSDSS